MFKSKKFLISFFFISLLVSCLIYKNLNTKDKHEIINNNVEKLESKMEVEKNVEVNETIFFKADSGLITSCHSENINYANAFVSGGECIIRGIAPNTNVIVIAKTEKSEITIKVNVISRQESNDGFQTDTSSNIIFAGGLNVDGSYTDYYDENTVMSQICDSYSIKNEYKQSSEEQGKKDTFVSSYSAVETCGNANAKFAAICLDPSKPGPTNTSPGRVSNYTISSKVEANTLLGKVSSYVKNNIIGKYVSVDNFITEGNNKWRIAASMAIRIIDIYENGGAFSETDSLADKYYLYSELAHFTFDNTNKKIKLGKSLSDSQIQTNIESILSNALCSEKLNGKDAWSGCTFSNNKTSNNTIERIINSSKVEWQPNQMDYKIIYNGSVILPVGTGEAKFSPNCTLDGFSCTSSFSAPKDLSDGRKKYEFTVVVNGNVNYSLPSSDEERKQISIAVKAPGLNPLSDSYVLKPINGTDRQRLLLINTAEPTVFLYFNATPNCNLSSPALNFNNCTKESCSSFRPELFSKAGCCDLIPDKKSYAYKYACESQTCVYSTFSNVCNNTADPNTNASYVIREGVKAENQESYSTCVIDVSQSKTSEKFDAVGNSLLVAEYKDNMYCDISCKEDWEFELGSFGNFTGENAVTAGTYFTLKNPIVVTGSRTCFTSFINYNSYLSDLTNHSKSIVDGYNSYVEAIANLEALLYPYSKSKSESFSVSGGNLKITSDKYCSDFEEYEKSIPKTETTTMPFCEWDCLRTDPNKGSNYNSCYAVCMAYPPNKTKVKEITTTTYTSVTRYRCKDTEENAPVCYHISYSPSTITYNKYSYNATSSKANSTVSETIDTKEGTSDIAISGLGTEKFDAGKFGEGYESSDGIKGTCPTAGVTSITFTDAGVAEYLEKKLGTTYKNKISSSQSTIIYNTQQIKEKSEAMFACQHWQLYNEADENNSKKTQNDILGANFMGKTQDSKEWKRQYYKIKSAFDPKISYLYDEEEYMTLIGKNNLLTEDSERNDIAANCSPGAGCFDASKSVDKTYSTNLSNTKDTCFPYKYKIELPDGTTKDATSYICHNYIKAWYYDTQDATGHTKAWNTNSIEGKTYTQAGNDQMVEATHKIALCTITSGSIYGSGKDGSFIIKKADDNKFHGGTCTNNYITYVKANYIKQTIKDGSIYKITGKWYTKDGADTKSFSPDGTKEAAIRALTENGDLSVTNKSYWSPIGTFATFPIKITTRRNMYQYLFSFGNIGSFTNGSLGRIMGTSTSIIKVNNTACFYEVKEELCICCGEPIDSYIDTISGITTTDYIKQNSIPYKESDYKKISKSAKLGFHFSIVSLNDINTDANRELEDNWKTSKYLIDGYDNHTTSKGEYLAKEIGIIGENAYNVKPEYAFELTPTAMAEIRAHNDANGYEIDLNTYTPYGLVSVEPLNNCYGKVDDCDWGLNNTSKFENGENITFVHFGSKFLEGNLASAKVKMKNYWKKGDYNKLLTSNKVCAISEKEYIKLVDKSHTEPVLQSLINKECRWIDYIDEDYDELEGKNKYYRLSFK